MTKFLRGNKIYLRGLTKEDCHGQYLTMANDAEVLSFVEGIGYYPLSSTDLEKYIESANRSSDLLLGIFENSTDTHVGNIRLSCIKPYHNSCALGIILHRDYMEKGYAYEAIGLLIKHAFSVMNIHRIQINVVDKNEGAIKLYKKIGVTHEGILRKAFYFNNEYHDIIVYSLLKNEYFKKDNLQNERSNDY